MIPKGAQSAYLVVYNSVLALGWAGVCVLSVCSIVENGSLAHVYADAGALARALQLASILETVHAAAGLVQSGVMTNLMQWTARTHALFAIVHANDLMHSSPFAGLMLLAWGFGESFRYPWCVPVLVVHQGCNVHGHRPVAHLACLTSWVITEYS